MKAPALPSSAAGMPDVRLALVHQGRLMHDAGLSATAGVNFGFVSEVLQAAELWWADAESTTLAREMAAGVPGDISGDESLFPQRVGLIAFDQPFHSGPLSADGKTVVTGANAVAWYRYQSAETGALGWGVVVYVGFPSGSENPAGDERSLTPVMWFNWDDGEPLSTALASDEDGDWDAFRWLIAMMALSKEPRLADARDELPDRGTKRRSQRAGVDLGATRVVYQRRSNSTGGNGDSQVYKHRWVVSGHWRSQPYGHERSLRRPVYIAPHVKGPDGAPLLHGEKVRAIVERAA